MASILGTLIGNFAGASRKPVFTSAPTAGARYAGAGLKTREVEVLEVIRETADAVTLWFKAVDGNPIRYRAGQFLTFVLPLGEKDVRRAYSFSSAPLDTSAAAVTVKRIAGGLASVYMNESVKPGDRLRVLGPSGEFTVEPQPEGARRFVFIAGGSGITPLLSLSRTLLRREPGVTIDLLYGNRSIDDVIFRRQLDELAATYSNFTVHHVLEQPPEGWQGAAGLLGGATILRLAGDVAGKQYYICGPEAMMDGAATALRSAGVARQDIKMERFAAPTARSAQKSLEAFPLAFARSGQVVTAKPGQTILEAGLDAGVDLEYSCTVGGCAACKVKVIEGSVAMDEPNCLSPEEREQGYVLACVGCATSPLTVEA